MTTRLTPREQARAEGIPEDQLYVYPDTNDPEGLEEHQRNHQERDKPAPSPAAAPDEVPTNRKVSLRSFHEVEDDVPTWAYAPAFNGAATGSIPVGSLAVLAGRPGAGKSSAGRWFCSQVTRGTLPGEWFGTPRTTAYIAGEESLKYNVKPGLRAAGADLHKVVYPEVNFSLPDGTTELVSLVPERDMQALTELLINAGVKLVVVDPLMEFMGGATDINKNNEVREKLRPWNQLADAIDGVVLGVVHLNKSGNGDVVAGINGSSAFGEVARAVLGFAKDPDSEEGHRVMSQEKNSMGSEDLAFTYHLKSVEVTTSTGKKADVGAFEIVGESDKSVGDVLRSSAGGPREDTGSLKSFVLDLLESEGGAAPAGKIKSDVTEAGYSWKTVQNNRGKWGITTRKSESGWLWQMESAHEVKVPNGEQGPYPRDVGTLGPSQVTALFEDPAPGKIPRSQGPTSPREEGSSPVRAVNPVASTVLDSLHDEHPLSLSTVKSSVHKDDRDLVELALEELVSQGMIVESSPGKYLRVKTA